MDIKYPKNDYLSKQKTIRSSLENSMNRFKNLIKDKIHPSNKTNAYEQNTVEILNKLLVEANELDRVSPGEGIFSLIVLTLRTNLKLKDMLIENEHKMRELERELRRLKGK